MTYPSLEQYNESLQHPASALVDQELRRGSVATTGLGLPLALCGGFALTYTVSVASKKFAVRCFHKKSHALEQRYAAIAAHLKQLRSPYFVDFEFQPQGVRVAGGLYPVVKMAWASGTTLGEFVEANYRNAQRLASLRLALRQLASYLEAQGLAHGDVQPGNLMVSGTGQVVQLIDYDGMYVPSLQSVGSAEIGHRNFQHPKRSAGDWSPRLDRFSFIELELALSALEVEPSLWGVTKSDGDAFLFKANDFADPANSQLFERLRVNPKLEAVARNFEAVCLAPVDQAPSLADFLAGRGIPKIVVGARQAGTAQSPAKYLSAYPVLDAANYAVCLSRVGDKVELIGQVVEVKEARTRQGKPYVFINFGPWQGKITKIVIWSEGLSTLADKPNASWVGKWVSVTGLLEPPYVNNRYGYSHLAVTVTKGVLIHLIGEPEAKFRLSGSSTRPIPAAASSNRDVLDGLRAKAAVGSSRPAVVPPASVTRQSVPPVSRNKAVLQGMQKTGAPTPPRSPQAVRTSTPSGAQPKTSSCFIATEIYGLHAVETDSLRGWRDRALVKSRAGRFFVRSYYRNSPRVVAAIRKYPWTRKYVRYVLDWIVAAAARRARPE